MIPMKYSIIYVAVGMCFLELMVCTSSKGIANCYLFTGLNTVSFGYCCHQLLLSRQITIRDSVRGSIALDQFLQPLGYCRHSVAMTAHCYSVIVVDQF